jgi:hypothetical protein
MCQSAFDRDPPSASKRDPTFLRFERLALAPSELVGVAETGRARGSIRPIVLNRKNALFAGHDHGAEHWACIASLIETRKLNGIDPQAYLTDVLTKLVSLWPASRLDELMPWAWAAEPSARRRAA